MQTWFLALRIDSSAQQGPVPTLSAISNERIERMATWVCWIVYDERAQVQSIRSSRFLLTDKAINDFENPQQYLVEPW